MEARGLKEGIMKMNAYPAARDQMASAERKKGVVRGWVGKIRQALAKFVVFDKDAIFKDPDWPHLWEHRR